jgi:predicted transposase/invertase (TIGR01784 family)
MAENSECFHSFFIKDEKNRTLTDKVGFFYINLCNFAAQQSEVTDMMRSWMSLLKNMQAMNEEDYRKQSGIFRELMDECRIEKLDTMEKENYEKSILEYEDVREAVEYAKELSFAEGVEKGIEKGIEKGMEKGMKKGMEKGLAQGVRNGLLQAAANLLKMGISIADVVKATGLSEEEVRELRIEN